MLDSHNVVLWARANQSGLVDPLRTPRSGPRDGTKSAQVRAVSLTNSADDISGFRPQPGMGSLPQSMQGGGTATNGKWRLLDPVLLAAVVSHLGVAHHGAILQAACAVR